MKDYSNLPTRFNGQDAVLQENQLPEKFIVLGTKSHTFKEHICLRNDVRETGELQVKEGDALCGNSAKREETGDCLHPCKSCLRILDARMKGYLYDEEKKEYYDPRSR